MFGGDAGYRPRVRSAYDERIYVHSPRGNSDNIGLKDMKLKGEKEEIAEPGPGRLCSEGKFR